MEKHSFQPAGNFALEYDDSWDKYGDLPGLDPYLRLVIASLPPNDEATLPLLIDPTPESRKTLPSTLKKFGAEFVKSGLNLDIQPAYHTADSINTTGELTFSPIKAKKAGSEPLRLGVALLLNGIPKLNLRPLAKRLSFPGVSFPCRAGEVRDSIADIGLPPGRKFNGVTLDGEGVIVGIIDDGCAIAHRNFINWPSNQRRPKTRLLALWDQTTAKSGQAAAHPAGFTYGRELTSTRINTALFNAMKGRRVDERKVYDELDYHIHEVASHGTHVMDIAAGNGTSLHDSPGVAPAADIVFVQLPSADIASSGPPLFNKILDGILYIFEIAKRKRKPAVINISYGAYAGPHDGTSQWETAVDNMLGVKNRAVVIAAGNGFEADCHAFGTIQQNGSASLRWILRPEDPTENTVDIWYGGDSRLELWLTPPGTSSELGPVKLGDYVWLKNSASTQTIGWISHSRDIGNNDNHIVIRLNETAAAADSAPSGTWGISFKNRGQTPTRFDAWIERDTGHPDKSRLRQSHFAPADAFPGGTLSNIATGKLTIAVGGYNTASQEICRYSACGPTRPTQGKPARKKPDVCAPAEGDIAGRGVLCASSLSAEPTRMNGTSASAPHVTGLVALMLQYAEEKSISMTTSEIIDKIIQGAANAASSSAALKPNRHQQIDARRPHKQKDVWSDLTGGGKISVVGTMNLL